MKETLLDVFASDCTLNVSSEPEMRVSVDKFYMACENFGLIINFQKTEVMRQSGPHALHTESKSQSQGRNFRPGPLQLPWQPLSRE